MTNRMNPALSKEVGLDPRPTGWPTSLAIVNRATPKQLLTWHRFLPVAEDDLQRALIDRIIFRLFKEDVNVTE